MKNETLHALIIAKTLINRSEQLCFDQDRYSATAGLIILQDSLEAFIYAILLEVYDDGEFDCEKKSFNELLGALKSKGVKIQKSSTLKSLNRQRVLAKHYAQVAEPQMVEMYFEIARHSIEKMLADTLGINIQEISLIDAISDEETKGFLREAANDIECENYLGALIGIRKAIFRNFENDYVIWDWRDVPASDKYKQNNFFSHVFKRGHKVPEWKRNKEWIENNVKIPTDYLQFDNHSWKIIGLEMGININEFFNIQRLTPTVFQSSQNDQWHFSCNSGFIENQCNAKNAKYCFDKAIAIISTKEKYAAISKNGGTGEFQHLDQEYIGSPIVEKPSRSSQVLTTIENHEECFIRSILTGFDHADMYYQILFDQGYEDKLTGNRLVLGYVAINITQEKINE